MTKINRALIDSATDQLKKLLEKNWDEISSMREENESEHIQIASAININYRGEEDTVKVRISFGIRQSVSSEEKINLKQLNLPLDGAAADGGGDFKPKSRVVRRPKVAALTPGADA